MKLNGGITTLLVKRKWEIRERHKDYFVSKSGSIARGKQKKVEKESNR